MVERVGTFSNCAAVAGHDPSASPVTTRSPLKTKEPVKVKTCQAATCHAGRSRRCRSRPPELGYATRPQACPTTPTITATRTHRLARVRLCTSVVG